jgi:DNA-binding response OmpR family regulator
VNEDPLTNIVNVNVGRLRRKLGACGEAIETVRGVGYRFNACVDAATVPASSGD